jgi:hypothetical protein
VGDPLCGEACRGLGETGVLIEAEKTDTRLQTTSYRDKYLRRRCLGDPGKVLFNGTDHVAICQTNIAHFVFILYTLVEEGG